MKKVATLRYNGQVVNEVGNDALPMAMLAAGGSAVGEGFTIVWRNKSDASMMGALLPAVLEAVGHRIRFLRDCMDNDKAIEIIKQSYSQALTMVQMAAARLDAPEYPWLLRQEDVIDPNDELVMKLNHCRNLACSIQNKLPEHKKNLAMAYAAIAGAIENVVYMTQKMNPPPPKQETASEANARQEIREQECDLKPYPPELRLCPACGRSANINECQCGLNRRFHDDAKVGHMFTPRGCACAPLWPPTKKGEEESQPPVPAPPVKCPGCSSTIDPDECWCGVRRNVHNDMDCGHSFVPNGCECFRTKAGDLNVFSGG